MKFKWKVVSGFLLLAALAGGAVTYWQQDKAPTAKRRTAIEVPAFTPEVDCSNAVTDAEKLICADDSLKQLDAELALAYHNDLRWQLHTAKFAINPEQEIQHGCIKQQREQCQQRIEATQRQWAADSRDQCKTADCLVAAYKSRITQINGQPEPLPSFRLSTNRRPAMCEAMLEVLNRAPREQLGACTEHDFTGTPFVPAINKAIQKSQMQFEEYLFSFRKYEKRSFNQYWQEDIEPKYQIGLKKLFSKKIDIDSDGQEELLLQYSEADSKCMALVGNNEEERKTYLVENSRKWRFFNDNEKYSSAKQNGWLSTVYLQKDGAYNPVRSGQLIFIDDDYVVLNQSGMLNIIYSSHKERILLFIVPKAPEVNYGWEGSEICSYWYNY